MLALYADLFEFFRGWVRATPGKMAFYVARIATPVLCRAFGAVVYQLAVAAQTLASIVHDGIDFVAGTFLFVSISLVDLFALKLDCFDCSRVLQHFFKRDLVLLEYFLS